jgi:pyruvate dehydrogenase E2 component (dihydrolipoamide acetyltransferase)
MAVGVIMPRQGQSVESCIIDLRVKEGDKVNAGDILFGYETDKASFEEESPVAGTILKVLVNSGDDVPCLDNVLVIGEPGENISEFAGSGEAAAEVKEEVKTEAAPAAVSAPVSTATTDSELKISPRAKNEAERQNLDLSKAVPTGPNGRIIERDVMVLAEKGYKVTAAAAADYAGGKEGSGLGGAVSTADLTAAPAVQTAASAAAAAVPAVPAAEYIDAKLTNIRKVIAKSMHASLAELAQLTNSTSFDATAILAFRERLKANAEKLGLPNITLNDIILYAVSRTLKKHPDLNAHFLNGDTMRHFSHVNLGMAVDTERGLLVPTLFGADTLSLADISRKAKELATSAQSGRISPDLLSGGTFTISNLGAMGIESFTPIINPPQTGILGVCSVVYRQKKAGDSFVTYPAMGLSLTYDHRVVDGAPASRFLKDLCTALESFDILLAL